MSSDIVELSYKVRLKAHPEYSDTPVNIYYMYGMEKLFPWSKPKPSYYKIKECSLDLNDIKAAVMTHAKNIIADRKRVADRKAKSDQFKPFDVSVRITGDAYDVEIVGIDGEAAKTRP